MNSPVSSASLPESFKLPSQEALEARLTQVMIRDQWRLRQRARQLPHEFKKPQGIQAYQKWLEQVERSSALRQQRLEALPVLDYPPGLPILGYKARIIEAIQTHQVVIVVGETGSGKTTQIPKMCLEAGRGIAGKIGITQPRRVAATSIARQLAKELQVPLGQAVGYKIRFSEQVSPQTLVQVMTDGLLLAETQQDRFLNEYDTLIIDEAHERSLNIDFLLGYLKRLLNQRRDLKLLITSANIDVPRFMQAFEGAPVLEVSGRMYPVEVIYQPLDEQLEEQGDLTMNDAAVNTIRDVLNSTRQGNLLVFMPGEREIREVIERVRASHPGIECLPLYSRLSNQEQQRIFREGTQRQVIVATNIAETSLTLPGIRFVVDTGLARISRYSNRSHTQRLPVEAISRSSADQRKGRAGRVQEGLCIRLYSEDSFLQRRDYTEPEILRSNLAGVILQMLALKLGKIEEFPFIDAPSGNAIREGMKLLWELGAVDESQNLTALGREMARLPIEPRLSRILLAAREENSLKEVLVIAAGASVQDPREVPMEKQAQARQMHNTFVHRDSDFLTLLNIWNRYHEEWETLKSENKMRKFCKQHFLSFVRMREWRDIHQQLHDLLSEQPGFRLNSEPAEYPAIHLALLAGYLNQIATKQQKNAYQAAGNREVFIFPGSGLHNRGKDWIVAGALIETSRIYAHMVANIEVEWLERLGRNLCRRSYSEAHFDEKSGTVWALERVTLYGLTIVAKRRVPFGKVNPTEATALFIREGLVEGKLRSHLEFFRHNRALHERLLLNFAKLRRSYDYEIEASMQDFYMARLQGVASVHDLNRLVKQQQKTAGREFLLMRETDLLPDFKDWPAPEDFPDTWEVAGHPLTLSYCFSPDDPLDGVTLVIPETLLDQIDGEALDWLIPGMREEMIFYLLKGLPKVYRNRFVPLQQSAEQIAASLQKTHRSFFKALNQHVYTHFQLVIPLEDWQREKLPDYLRLRLEVRDSNGQVIASGRDWHQLLPESQRRFQERLKQVQAHQRQNEWNAALREWELPGLTSWTFERLPLKIEVAQCEGLPLYAYPGLIEGKEGIRRTLFATAAEAQRATFPALHRLLALSLGPELAWLERDLEDLRDLQLLYAPLGQYPQLKKQARAAIHQHLFHGPWISTREEFETRLKQGVQKFKGLWPAFLKALEGLLQERVQTLGALHKYLMGATFGPAYHELHSHLMEVLPPDFLQTIPYERWFHLPRYLKALAIRAERLAFDPVKDAEKRKILEPYLDQWKHWQRYDQGHWVQSEPGQMLRWMLEEFRVSLFAPELRTAFPISAKRLDKYLEQIAAEAQQQATGLVELKRL